MPGRVHQNDAPALSLASSLAAGATTIPVNQSITGVETPISYTINSGGANQEIVTLVDKNTSTSPSQFEGVVRGCDGTADQSHSSGEVLTHEATARDFVTPRQFAFSGDDMWTGGKWQSLTVPYVKNGTTSTSYNNDLFLARFSLAERLELDKIYIQSYSGGSTDGQVDFVLYRGPSPDEYVQMLGTITGSDGLDSAGGKSTGTLGIEIGPGTWWLGRRGHGFSTPPTLAVATQYMDPTNMAVPASSGNIGKYRSEMESDGFTDYQNWSPYYQSSKGGILCLLSFNEIT